MNRLSYKWLNLVIAVSIMAALLNGDGLELPSPQPTQRLHFHSSNKNQ